MGSVHFVNFPYYSMGIQDLRIFGGGGQTDRRTDRQTDGRTETGENCPMWNHRSSAPPRPLPKKGESEEQGQVGQ